MSTATWVGYPIEEVHDYAIEETFGWEMRRYVYVTLADGTSRRVNVGSVVVHPAPQEAP